MTHTSSVNKTAPVSLVWTPPPKTSSAPMDGAGGGGQVIFVATVVQKFDTYWVGIYSDAFSLPMAAATGAAMGAGTPAATAMSGSAGLNPTTANLAFGGERGIGAATSSESF